VFRNLLGGFQFINIDPRENHVDYVEFPAQSAQSFASVKRFYKEVFGWSFRDWGDDYSDTKDSILARQAISSGAKAEDMALSRRVARERREGLERRDLAVRAAEESTATANQEITRVKRELENERHARELAERDSLNATEQLRDARTEIARIAATNAGSGPRLI